MYRMLFLVDGYNVTRRDPATRSLQLESQRDALVARLRARGGDLLGSGRIVVVFDGEGGPGLSTGGDVPVEVVYAHERSADDEIVRIAAAAQGGVAVVSSDRGLVERVRTHGRDAIAREASCCFDGARAAGRRGSRGTIAREAGLPKGANAITRELKGIWLDNDE